MDGKIAVFLGAAQVVSPLGTTLGENFDQAVAGYDGLNWLERPFSQVDRLYAGKITTPHAPGSRLIHAVARQSIAGSLAAVVPEASAGSRWLFVLCTTKGDIDYLKAGDFARANPVNLMKELQAALPFTSTGTVVSCACISGIAGVSYAADRISAGHFDHALVLGIDLLSEFTTLGFASFFALEDGPCKPFDRNRKGLNLGEGAGSLVLSRNQELFSKTPFRYLGGATSNDANHISGPSRTGEGLVRAIIRTLRQAEREVGDIGFISAHGTGTPFNDDMESLAFSRMGLQHVPLNSLKGFFGHTLGASGLVELAMTMESMERGVFLKTKGCAEPGTVSEVHVLTENLVADIAVALKTASGFGGCNAAVLIEKS